jgi:hypothetical protein
MFKRFRRIICAIFGHALFVEPDRGGYRYCCSRCGKQSRSFRDMTLFERSDWL